MNPLAQNDTALAPSAEMPVHWLQQLADAAQQTFLYWSLRERRFVYANRGVSQLFGFSPEELLKTPDHWQACIEPEMRAQALALLEGWTPGDVGAVRDAGYRIYRPDGLMRHVQHTAVAVAGTNGTVIGVANLLFDHSSHMHMVEALRQSEIKYRNIFENASIGIFQSTISGRFVNMNPCFARLLGYDSPMDAIAAIHSIADQVYASPTERQTVIEKLTREPEFSFFVLTFRNRHGRGWTAHLHARLVKDNSGNPLYVEGFVEDITERHAATEAIRANEARLRMLLDRLPAIVWTVSKEMMFTSVQGAGVGNLGAISEAMIGSRLEEFAQTEDPSHPMLAHHRHALHGVPVAFEFELGGRSYQAHLEPLRSEEDNIAGVLGVALDVTERRKAEGERDRFFESSHDLLVIINLDGCIRQVNRAWQELLGLENGEIVGTSVLEYIHPKDQETTRIAIRNLGEGTPLRFFENRLIAGDGDHRWISWNAFTLEQERCIYAVGRDVTEQRRLEAERRELERHMQQAEKLESLGVLAGGIAHDFNNLLTAIMGHTQMAAMRVGDNERVARHLAEIENAAKRASEVTREMLAYARRERVGHEPLCLTELVRSMTNLLESSCPGLVRLRYELAEGLPLVGGVTTQLWQTIIRLVINAADAIGQKPGQIVVRTGTVRLQEHDLPHLMPPRALPAGNCVFIEIEDNGCGMSQDECRKLFDPFFSTQTSGHGLGLSASLGIVRNHRGGFQVHSEPGQGTRIRVILPPLADSNP